jgi:hypothetical protein
MTKMVSNRVREVRMKRFAAALGAAAFAALTFLGASVASADLQLATGFLFLDPTGSGLTGSPCTGTCPGPYASIAIDLIDAHHVTFDFHGLSQGGFTYFFGGAGPDSNIAGLTLNKTGVTGSLLAGTITPFNTPTLSFASPQGPQQVDGVGTYNFRINSSANGSSFLVGDIFFKLTLDSASDAWSCIFKAGLGGCGAGAVIDNQENLQSWIDGFFTHPTFGTTIQSNSWAEGHMSVCTGSTGSFSCPGLTSWVGGAQGTVAEVPEPGTLALLGSGLVLIGTLARRFRK